MTTVPGNSAALPTARSRARSRSQPRSGPALSDLGDDDLIRAVHAGEQPALGEIYRRYAGAVWAVARRVCNDRVLAEDVSQTVFTDLWRRPGRFDPARGRLRPWLVAQAHARAVDTVRSETARQRRQDREGHLAPVTELDVEATVHAAALGDDVRRAVEQLSADEREAIVLSYFGGHSYRETAEMLGAPEGTVKTRIRRGLMGLRRALEAQGVTP
ncbi:MAG TPA: sigma-70 family RNA polymerase sigma factor [Acidimicrobiales bacterium]|nr:sigma-70 family RNA polymerase sigma factor [Acidimicrobiales bacterium]